MPDPASAELARSAWAATGRVHKSALGVACGVIAGGALFAVTAVHVVFGVDGLPLPLLGEYFAGYDLSWRGAFIGLAWGLAVGFVDGWLLGFVHNFSVGAWTFVMRTRHDFAATRNFLDHI
jgi:hypothetical protein